MLVQLLSLAYDPGVPAIQVPNRSHYMYIHAHMYNEWQKCLAIWTQKCRIIMQLGICNLRLKWAILGIQAIGSSLEWTAA